MGDCPDAQIAHHPGSVMVVRLADWRGYQEPDDEQPKRNGKNRQPQASRSDQPVY